MNCPICDSQRFKRYNVRVGYCQDCYRQTGTGTVNFRIDGTTRLNNSRAPTRQCESCGVDVFGRKRCDDPVCKGTRIWKQNACSIWYQTCAYKPCNQMFVNSKQGSRHRTRYCSVSCSRRASSQSAIKRNGRRRTPTRDVRLRVAYLNGYKCDLCHRLIDLSLPAGHDRALEIDHIEEWAKGGGHELSNLRPMHRDCHRKRRISDTVQYRML